MAPPEKQQLDSKTGNRTLLATLIFGLVAWGLLLGLGALLFAEHPFKPLILIGAVGLFVTVWLVLLSSLRRRKTK